MFKKHIAAALSGCLLLGAVALAQSDISAFVYAQEAQQEQEVQEDQEAQEDQGVSLAIAGRDGEEDDQTETEEVTEAVTETEAPVVYETLETTSTGDGAITALDVSEIVENCMPSIVAITNKSVQEVESYFYGKTEISSESAGSGIIIAQNDTELLIATNKHVVKDADEITVCFTVDAEDAEDLVVPAVTKGTDGQFDLAVVAVNLKDIPEHILSQLKIATLGSSDKLKVGEASIVIGNALGTGQTVTCGIISALEREITTEAGTFTELQTDAAINFGCSGGAVLNKRGEVIGITSAKAATDYAESMGYAIPIDTAIPVLSNLINRQTRATVENHGFIGITVVPVTEEAMQMYNMPAGAYVYEVSEGSAGDLAGIKKGNIITRFDGITIGSSDELVETLVYYEVGETVKVEIQVAEGGSYVTKEVEVTLQEGAPAASSDNDSSSQDPREQTPRDENQKPEMDGYDYRNDFPQDEYYGENNDGYEDYGFGDIFDYFFNRGNGGF